MGKSNVEIREKIIWQGVVLSVRNRKDLAEKRLGKMRIFVKCFAQ